MGGEQAKEVHTRTSPSACSALERAPVWCQREWVCVPEHLLSFLDFNSQPCDSPLVSKILFINLLRLDIGTKQRVRVDGVN